MKYKKIFVLFLLFIICTTQITCAVMPTWDDHLARKYANNSEMQRRWAWRALAPLLKDLRGDEEILDFGCGDGKITADISRFVPSGSVVGVDLSKTMIAWAQRQYHPYEYPNVSFQIGDFLNPRIDKTFDLIVSFCAMQHCLDQEGALRNMARLLKSEGKLLILVPSFDNPAWIQARTTVQASPKWARYWVDYKPREFRTDQHYMKWLESVNLRPVKVEMIKTLDPFVDREAMLDWIIGSFSTIIPDNELREFYNEWIDEYLRLDPGAIDTIGVIYAKFGVIVIEATTY